MFFKPVLDLRLIGINLLATYQGDKILTRADLSLLSGKVSTENIYHILLPPQVYQQSSTIAHLACLSLKQKQLKKTTIAKTK